MSHEPAEGLSDEDKKTVAESPLNEAADGGASIQELFDRDPLKMSDKDYDRIVEHFRSSRKAWEAEDGNGTRKKSVRAKAAAKPKPKVKPGLNLTDLGL